ncbi:peptidoglycan editing factor PgeF [Gracilibacillus alcaliphilus]|uniref:peptidoglycan editing factor PgeF n=1 Tax=Gracilibacillus alcaliphilus TaxID=1401441 RepID=UPI00195C8DB3|nr:peptidoglycan editing factor PgeF [Gracilibacillus alcaliphilus]MBM7679573.1 YfiH family protein [Gracilibacillus alcaliphilus]
MEPFVLNQDQSLLIIQRWQTEKISIIAGFTTRYHGVSNAPYQSNNLGFHVGDNPDVVLENRRRLAERIDTPLEHWVAADQVHHHHVKEVTTADLGKGVFSQTTAIAKTDGLLTRQPGVLCTALFADCVPVFFIDRKQRIVAIAHAGWKGTVANIVGETVRRFQSMFTDVDDLEVVIGPSICSSCYQVNDHVIQHINPRYQDTYTGSQGKYQLDLKELNRQLLIAAGVPSAQIFKTEYCTAHDPLFFSHRRDSHPTGRMMGYIGIK